MNYMRKQDRRQNNRTVGTYYEQVAKNYMIGLGYELLQMNYRCKLGEIDMIVKDGDYTVFIEIKYRKDLRCGYPRESVNFYKQRTILAVAKYYLMCKRLYDKPCRFDVVEILDKQITHIKNAFMEG